MHPIHQLIDYALYSTMIEQDDTDYLFNRLIHLFKEDTLTPLEAYPGLTEGPITAILAPLLDQAYSLKLIPSNSVTDRDLFEAYLMDILMPRPSDFQARFARLYQLSPKRATDDFYRLSQASNYIKMDRIAKNKAFVVPSDFGEISITINLSKPEKDPRAIKAALHQQSSDYPACLLCKEHVGHYGDYQQPPRTNHRIIKTILNEETFYFQFSPYVYYNEHAIVLHESHIPMEVGRHTFIRLFDFVDQFPHYFMGSNAGLPIVGGSILSHEHYQGGHAEFPIDAAKSFATYTKDSITYELLHWPLSVIRLKSRSRTELIDIADELRLYWLNYTNESLEILAKTDHPHNAITPIVRKKEGVYQVDIALRNNRTTNQYPDGIFHPHKERHHIKKENIGLIEVMGLAILPGRLDQDLSKIKEILQGKQSSYKDLDVYRTWVEELKTNAFKQPIDRFIEEEVGKVFVNGLIDCGVFKPNDEGRHAFMTMMEAFLQ